MRHLKKILHDEDFKISGIFLISKMTVIIT